MHLTPGSTTTASMPQAASSIIESRSVEMRVGASSGLPVTSITRFAIHSGRVESAFSTAFFTFSPVTSRGVAVGDGAFVTTSAFFV